MNCAKPYLVVLLLNVQLFAAIPFAVGQERKNVLFIAIDDLKNICGYSSEEPGNFLQVLYPDPVRRSEIREILTPNIDQLASQGLAFTRAQCPSQLCYFSRTALLTGFPARVVYPQSWLGFRESYNPKVRNAITLPQNLIGHGYHAAGVGKIFHSHLDADVELSWNEWIRRYIGTKWPYVDSIWEPSTTFPSSEYTIRDC